MRSLLDRVFQREEMNGDGRCATYLVRWTLLKLWGGIGVYLHHFVGDDWSRDLHDHPKRFISIGLRGSYIEETPILDWFDRDYFKLPPGKTRERRYTAPWVRTFPAHHIHRIRLVDGKPAWTLVIVLRTVRDWGFWHDDKWIPWREYVESDTATQMKSC